MLDKINKSTGCSNHRNYMKMDCLDCWNSKLKGAFNLGKFDSQPIEFSEEAQYHFIPVKCDICGSTAIDHTEMNCQLNRSLKLNNKDT